MPTLTERKPPKRVPGKVRSINKCAQLEPEGRPESYDVCYGPFPSWFNVKEPWPAYAAWIPAAIGDGIADDTAAIQAALDFVGNPVTQIDQTNYLIQQESPGFTADDPGWRNAPRGFPKSSGNQAGYDPNSGYSTVYLPAGTYRITKTLRMFNRVMVVICGEDPNTTKLIWDGDVWLDVLRTYVDPDALHPQGQGETNRVVYASNNWFNEGHNVDVILTDGAWAGANIRRLCVDGNNKARVCINQAFSGRHGGTGPENGEYTDVWVMNCETGVNTGGDMGWHDATTPVYRGRYINCWVYGHTVTHFNTLMWNLFDCLFLNCGYGLRQWAGSIMSYNSLYINTRCSEVLCNGNQFGGFRGNTFVSTHDGVLTGPPNGWRLAIGQLNDYLLRTPWTITGNLFIDAIPRGTAISVVGAPLTYVDNAFYDPGYLTNEQLPGQTPIGLNYNSSNRPNLVTGQTKDGFHQPIYLSGNIYNGQAMPVQDADWYGFPASDNQFLIVDNQVPSNWTPANHLQLTSTQIKAILQASKDSQIIQDLIDLLPQAPPITNPNDPGIRYTDMGVVANPLDFSQVDAVFRNWIDNVDPTKNNLLHVPWHPRDAYSVGWSGGHWIDEPLGIWDPGTLIGGNYHIPGGIQFTLIGDIHYGTNIWFMYDYWHPLFAVGDGLQAAKFRMMYVTLRDFSSYASPPVPVPLVDIVSPDMPGARVHMTTQMGSDAPWTSESRTGVISIEGFDNLRAQSWCPMVIQTFDVVGTGKIHTSDEDTVLRSYAMVPYPAPGRSAFRVFNGGSVHVYDYYMESNMMVYDMRGQNGYFANENLFRYHLAAFEADGTPAEGWNQGVNDLRQFTGHQLWLGGLVQTDQRMLVDYPQAGSSTTIWGVAGSYSTNSLDLGNTYWVGNFVFPYTELPQEWTQNTIQDASGLFGLTPTEGSNAPSNLQIGGNHYYLQSVDTPATSSVVNTLTELVGDPADETADAYFSGVVVPRPNTMMGAAPSGNGIVIGGTEAASVYPVYEHPDTFWWPLNRGDPPLSHPIGTAITYSFPPWNILNNNCADFPTSAPNFVVTPMMRDALRYRRFPEPSKITDPNITDIVFNRTSVMGFRYPTVRVKRQ